MKTFIKFNDDLIDIDTEKFNYVKDNANYYKNINIKTFDYTLYMSKTDNYKKLYKNFIYINKLNNYNINLLSELFNTNSIVLNKNEDNIINSISIHSKKNHINNFENYLFDTENKNIEIRLINQYLYYMNIYFTNKYKSIEKQINHLKNKFLNHNHNNDDNQITDVMNTELKYLKYKINNQNEDIIILKNKLIISMILVIKILKDIFYN